MQHTDKDPSPEGDTIERYRAPALDRGLDILEILAGQAGGLTRAEIVRELGLGPSQIYRMLERLVARGYVARTTGGDRYALTMKLFLLATHYPPLRRLVAHAQPLMDEFSTNTRQPCHLVTPDQGTGIVVAQASPGGHWEFRARAGAQLDLFTTSSGLTLLAFQNPARIIQTLNLWGVPRARERLSCVIDQLETIRRDGRRIAPSAQLVGVTDISVPIFGPGHEALGVLTCAYIEHPDDSGLEKREEALSALVCAAQNLSCLCEQDQPAQSMT